MRWEYASVVWQSQARKIGKRDPEYLKLSADVRAEWERKNWAFYWWLTWTFFIWLPGATESEKRHGWSTGEERSSTTYLGLLNELGADGWEVVSREISASAVGKNLGRDTAGIPIETRTLLKRPVA